MKVNILKDPIHKHVEEHNKKNNRICPGCDSDVTLYNSYHTRKCVNCDLTYTIDDKKLL